MIDLLYLGNYFQVNNYIFQTILYAVLQTVLYEDKLLTPLYFTAMPILAKLRAKKPNFWFPITS